MPPVKGAGPWPEERYTCLRKPCRRRDFAISFRKAVPCDGEIFTVADAIIVVAGMDGALPSVVAGLVDVPVIGLPTSVGYGASLGGLAALLAMLNSCASGVTVVNIDNGFGAAFAASARPRFSNWKAS